MTPRDIRLGLLFTILAATLLLAGCGGAADDVDAAEAVDPGRPTFTVVNAGRGPIRAVAIKANLMMSFRDLGPGESSTLTSASLEVTDRVDLRWTDEKGEHHFVRKSTDPLGEHPASVTLTIERPDRVRIGR